MMSELFENELRNALVLNRPLEIFAGLLHGEAFVQTQVTRAHGGAGGHTSMGLLGER